MLQTQHLYTAWCRAGITQAHNMHMYNMLENDGPGYVDGQVRPNLTCYYKAEKSKLLPAANLNHVCQASIQ